ncbi:MAG: M20/M25/M40 family metallo-hydrolase [bacterium]
MDFLLLKRLCETAAIAGREEAVRAIVIEELKPFVDDISIDVMGNVIAFKKGKGKGKRKRVMLAAHMDEIGFLVKSVDDKGFVKLFPMGGIDAKNVNGRKVVITGKEGTVSGMAIFPNKEGAATVDGIHIDTGLSGDDAKAKIQQYDIVTMDRPIEELGNYIVGKAMDDRVGIYCLIDTIKKLKDPEVDVYAVATAQEEIGTRGAGPAAFAIMPDVGVAMDVTGATDYPGADEVDVPPKLGNGPSIRILDGSLICHPKLIDHFREVASKHKIPHQTELMNRGGTDAGAIQRSRAGAAAITVSVPVRYMHSVNELVCASDLDAQSDLMARFVEDVHTRDYHYD